MKRALELSLAISLALGASQAFAVGLGQIQVKSRLNQPLVAEIPVTVDRGSEADTLAISLASAEEFSRIGIDRAQIGVPLEFVLVKTPGGQTVIRVTSAEPVRAPFLDFLLAANWNNGRVLREYTVLLDPPTTAPAVAAAPAPVREPARPAVDATPPAPAPKAMTEAEPAQAEAIPPKPAPMAVPVVSAESEPMESIADPAPARPAANGVPPSVAASNGSNYGPVAAGETLWEIAQATLPDDGVGVNQLMLALLRTNPQAFVDNNINRLKRGAILRIPSAEDIRAVGSMREATAQVRTQIAEWRQQTVTPTLLAGTAAGNVDDRVNDASAAPSFKNVMSDRLALVPPELGNKDGLASTGQAGSSAGAATGNVSAAELARANEALESRSQEAGELRSRVDDLEALKSKNERLISLKDSEIADLQRKLAAVQITAASEPVITPAQEPISTADTATASATETEPVTETAASQVAAVNTGANVAAPVPESSKDDIWGEKQAGADAEAEVPPIVPGVEGSAQTATLTTTGSTGIAPDSAVVGAPVDVTATPAVEAPMSSADLTNPPVADGTAADERPWYLDPRILGGAGLIALLIGFLAFRSRGKAVAVADRPSLADQFASDGAAAAMVQPAGDGMSVQEEERLLAEQIAEDPDDLVARLELLSIYYADNRIDEFRDAALEMQPYVNDPREAEWVQVRAMGEDLLPDDPLFRSGDRETDPAHAGFVHVGNDSGANAESELRWSSDDDDRVEPIIDITQTRVVDTPLVPTLDDERRYAPAPEVEMEVDESETFEFDDEADVVVADAASDRNIDDDIADAMEEHRGMEFSLEDAPEIDAVRAAPAVAVAAERELPPKGRPLTEYASEAKRPDQSFEFDLPPLDFDTEFSKPASVTAVEPSHDLDDPIELDEEFLVGEDALGTKLDLARAYADMGDPDGARGMLEEVLSQGDAGQKDKARKLLEELG